VFFCGSKYDVLYDIAPFKGGKYTFLPYSCALDRKLIAKQGAVFGIIPVLHASNPIMARPKHDLPDDDIEYVSKTEMKTEMTALQKLGEKLIPLDKKQLATLKLPERLFDAILAAKKITANGATARQKQFIGKLMRDVDPEPINELLNKLAGLSDRHSAWLHRLERLRASMLTDAKVVENFVTEHPDVDIQQLRQLVRNALKERELQKPAKAFRELFKLIKQYIPEPALPGLEASSDDDEIEDAE
jgi:ribosome-associated protein